MLSSQNIFQIKRLFASLVIATSFALTACGGGSSNKGSDYSGTLQNPYFYSITSPSGKTSYMLGSVHVGVGADELPDYVMKAFSETRYHFSEIIEVYKSFDASYELLQTAYNRNAFNATYARLKNRIPVSGGYLTQEQKNRAIYLGVPSYVADVIGQNASCALVVWGEAIYSRPARFLDYELGKLSIQKNKKILALENDSVRKAAQNYQIQMTGESAGSDDCDIKDYLVSDETARQVKAALAQYNVANFIGAYRTGNLNVDTTSDYEVQYRNKKWIPVMKPYLEKGKAFFTFGAAHMMGSNGVVNLLQRAGYTVNRLNSAFQPSVNNGTLSFNATADITETSTPYAYIQKPIPLPLKPIFGRF